MKVLLMNMPFADLNRPSIGLTQLAFLLDGGADLLYLNHDFGVFFGTNVYRYISASYITGLGDWLFRGIAFPDAPDNKNKYFKRHFPRPDKDAMQIIGVLESKLPDLEQFLKELIDKYNILSYDIVGFTSMFSQTGPSLAMAKILKEMNPEMVTVMGGANCESPMGGELVKLTPQLDFAFSGPSLVSFPEFVKHLEAGNTEACHQMKGVFSAENADSVAANALFGQDRPIDETIPLNYDGFNESFDRCFPGHGGGKELTFETSRGCWWGQRSHCTFCGLNGEGMFYRQMQADVAIEQFNSLFKMSDNFQKYSCVDNILPKDYTTKVFPNLDVPENIEIFYEVKADLSQDEMKLLSEKKVKWVQPGIEALNTTTLKLMKKGSTAFGNVNFLMNCCLYDIHPSWNLLVGFPGEDESIFSKYVEDIPKLYHLPPPSDAYPVRFDRFSPYFNKAEEYDLKLKPYDFYKLVYPFEAASVEKVAYYFLNYNFGAAYNKAMVRWITKLQAAVAEWNRRWSVRSRIFPELYFADSDQPDLIHDTRNGRLVKHRVSDLGRRILKTMNRATAISSIPKKLGDVDLEAVDLEVKKLNAKKLLFFEGSRYLNMVLPERGSPALRQRVQSCQ